MGIYNSSHSPGATLYGDVLTSLMTGVLSVVFARESGFTGVFFSHEMVVHDAAGISIFGRYSAGFENKK